MLNRIAMRLYTLLLLTVLLYGSPVISGTAKAHAQKKPKTTPITIGEEITFQSAILGESRTLNIYLPKGYSPDSVEGFPVIYLLDGSMDEDFLHIAGLVDFASFPWIGMLPPTIVVGIANVDRKRDFTYPTSLKQDQIDFPTTGKSAAFIEFLGREVQPLIQERYHCSGESTLIGQSLGGLLAAEVLLRQPELFTHYIIISPSLWWDDESLLKVPLPSWEGKKKLFVGVGKEGAIMEDSARRLFEKLVGVPEAKRQLLHRQFPDRGHGDVLHEAVYEAFESLFWEKKEE